MTQEALSIVTAPPQPEIGNQNITISINPATGETNAVFPLNTQDDVFAAVRNARRAQPDWAALPIKARVRYVKKLADFLQGHSMKIAETISKDNGKTIGDAMTAECMPAVLATGYYSSKAARFLKDRRIWPGSLLTSNYLSKIVRVPYGVIGIISPWNYPFSIPYSEVVMALLAGNTVILKTASETQMVGHILKECIESAHLPPGVFTHLNLPGRIAGDAFIDAGVDKLFFTGSVSVGKYLMKKASERLTPLVLELGGNDAMIVCEDADLHRATSGTVWAGLQNAGQSCGGIERIYVQRSIYPQFLSLLKEKVDALKVGNGQSMDSDIGAMTTQRQMQTVQHHVQEALSKGAKIYARSSVPADTKGWFHPCMVLTDVNHDMLVMKEETFGPVVGVMPYDTIDEAIALANDSDLGLTASVWSGNRGKAKQIARKIKAGAVMINDHLLSHGLAETPWGGIKESGIGRTHGELGFNEMTWPQVVVDQILPFARRNFWWQPFEAKQLYGMKGIIDLLHAKNLLVRLVGGLRLLWAFLSTFAKR
ncbi:MAG: aldehyde dehydrogenase family protein [Desulfobacteraceae bacterium]|nr:aldehyde dehydrogenase family protein [Desulfobacteraceae bacterium]